MDPNVALARLRRTLDAIENGPAPIDGGLDVHEAVEYILEDFVALDEWLSKGGFLPKAWQAQHKCLYDHKRSEGCSQALCGYFMRCERCGTAT